MVDEILVSHLIYEEFSNALYGVMLVSKLKGYNVVYKPLNKLRSGNGTFNIGMLSLMNNDKIILNIVIDVTKKNIFNCFNLICMKNYNSSENKNFDFFCDEYKKEGLFHSHKRSIGEGLLFTEINDITKAFLALERIILMFK
jgi:hypothetical protein